MTTPHKAIINISCSVYPVLSTGELSGQIVSRNELKNFGVSNKLLEITGSSLEDCLEKLKLKMESFK